MRNPILAAADAIRRACHCEACGAELLRTPHGEQVCADWNCPASPVGGMAPPPELVRAGELRTAGYVPASAIRPAMPSLRRASPPEAPTTAPRKSAAQRAQEVTDDIRWAQAHQELLARGRSIPAGREGRR